MSIPVTNPATMRLDKWLWAARFFKTRMLAARACELGRVELGGQPVNAARNIGAGDQLRITTEAGVFAIAVVALSEVRGPAAAAQLLYQESDESRQARSAAAAERKLQWQAGGETTGRPSKRDRRRIIQFRSGRG